MDNNGEYRWDIIEEITYSEKIVTFQARLPC
jgi:hypothetical protein